MGRASPVAADIKGAEVRAHAARQNARVIDEGVSLARLGSSNGGLAARDAALSRAMLVASLRWHHRHDWQLAQLLDRPLKSKDRLLAALLRVGLTQIESLRVPDHAAVAATVGATAELGLGHARGLVNAVLRRFLREQPQLAARSLAIETARFSHPVWLIDNIRQDWPSRWQSILEANNVEAPIWLRVNRIKSDRAAYLDRLADAGLEARPDSDTPDAVELIGSCPIESLPGFAGGLVSVQDRSAQRVADLLRLAPGQRVLDACAAPGGKAAHILERCAGISEMVAIDSDAARLDQVAENLARLELKARLCQADATNPSDWHDGRGFDRILVDAPCSSTGVIRRHPDIKVLRRPEDPAAMAERQRRMLDALWPLLKPGGLLVYVTCSVLTAENQGVSEAFAASAADAGLAPFDSPDHFQVLPGETGGDGFYYACLSKGEKSYK